MNKSFSYLWPFAMLVMISPLFTGCASSLQGDVYTRSEARQPQSVYFGTIEYLRPVQIEGTKSGVGATAGAVFGGIGGSSIGGGKGSDLAATVGAVVGGVTGAAVEEGMTRTQGVEITVRQSNGALRAYVQVLAEGQVFRVGDRVRVVTGSNARVYRY